MATMTTTRRAVLLAAALATGGCATTIHGTRQTIAIDSTPPGATATVLPEGITVQTPGEVVLVRKYVHTVRLALDGFCGETIYLDRMVSSALYGNLLLGGLIGTAIDTDDGAAFVLQPDAVSVTLRPVGDDPSGCRQLPVCRQGEAQRAGAR
jgi:hypothetical protein